MAVLRILCMARGPLSVERIIGKLPEYGVEPDDRGRHPRHFVPGAYIQFLRLDGIMMSDAIVDEERIEGDLDQVVHRVDDKLAAHNRVRVGIVSHRLEQRLYVYPLTALQQLVRNAIMHRTYENTNAPIHVYWFNDRIEIRSPGGPYGAVNVQNFGKPGIVDYRNPHIADAMKVLGHVQRFGVGIQTAQVEMESNGNPPIEFLVDHATVLCILRPANAPDDAPDDAPNDAVGRPLTPLQEELLKVLEEDPLASYKALAARLDCNETTIMRNIRRLKEAGVLRRVGSHKSGRWRIMRKHPKKGP